MLSRCAILICASLPSCHNCPMHLRQTKDSTDKGTYYGDFWTGVGYVGSSSHSFFLSTSAFSPSSPVTGLESRQLKEISKRRRRRSPSIRSFSRRVSSASERSPHEATCSQFLLDLALPGKLPGNAWLLIWEGVLPPCVVARGFL